MTIRNSRYIYKNNFSNIAYLLDENECNNALASSDYDPYWSRLYLKKYRNILGNGIYFTPIIYKGDYYILFIARRSGVASVSIRRFKNLELEAPICVIDYEVNLGST